MHLQVYIINSKFVTSFPLGLIKYSNSDKCMESAHHFFLHLHIAYVVQPTFKKPQTLHLLSKKKQQILTANNLEPTNV